MPQLDKRTVPTVAVVVGGSLIVTLNLSMVSVALPTIGRDLGVVVGLDWVITGYLLAFALAQPVTGWLADRFGTKTVFIGALGAFSIGSLLIAGAWSLETVVAFRVLQGLGGGALIPLGVIVVHQLFPPEQRGLALGLIGTASMASPAAGPILGGWIVAAVDWRVIFLASAPLGAIVALASWRVLRAAGARDRRRFDWVGLGLVTVGLGGIVFASAWAGEATWTDPGVVALLMGGLLFSLLFVMHELRTTSPLLELRMFAHRAFRVAIGAVWLTTAAHLGPIVLVPVLLQAAHGMGSLEAGMVVAPSAVMAALVMPLAGRLADRIGPRTPVTAGAGVMAAAAVLLATLPLDTSRNTLVMVMAFHGVGTGLAAVTLINTALNGVPTQLVNQAGAVWGVSRRASGVMALAVLGSVITTQIGGLAPPGMEPAALLAAYRSAFWIVVGLSLAGAVLSIRLVNRASNLELLERRRSEAAAESGP